MSSPEIRAEIDLHSELAGAEAASLYRALVTDARDPVVVVEEESERIVDANVIAAALYTGEVDDLKERDFDDLFFSVDGRGLRVAEVLAAADAPLRPECVRVRTNGGLEHDVELCATRVTFQRRALVRVVLRQRRDSASAEHKLTEALRRQKALLETMADAVIVIDEKGTIHSFNAAAGKIFGYGPLEVVGCNVNVLMRSQDAHGHDGHLERYRATGKKHIIGSGREVTGLRKDGSTVPLELSIGEMVSASGERMFTGILRDITDRRRAEQARYQLASVIERTPAAVITFRDDGTVRYLNRSARELTDVARAWDPEGVKCEDLICPDTLKVLREEAFPALEEDMLWIGRGAVLDIDNKRVLSELTVLSVSDSVDEQEPPTFTLIAKDIRAEEEAEQLERRLVRTDKMDSLGVLAAGVAHDFNNLLLGMLANTSFLLDTVADGTEMQEAIEEIDEIARRAAELVGQLLSYTGRARIEAAEVDLAELVAAAPRLLGRRIPSRIKVESRIQAKPVIEADRVQVNQVLMNLIVNAADAYGEVKGEVRVSLGQGPLQLHGLSHRFDDSSTGALFAVIEVSDDAGGINADVLERVFDPFYSTKSAGKGLGLASVLGIVKQHRGAISVSTIPGEGTAFRVFLPLEVSLESADAQRHEEPAQDDEEVPPLFLVVDDTPSVRNGVRRMLQALGCNVILADGVENGRIAFHSNRAHIHGVICDLQMPDGDGRQLLEELHSFNSDLPVVLMSGFPIKEAASYVHTMQKPFRKQDILSLVQAVRSRISPDIALEG